jgi:signal transduction histidine kinase
MRRRLKAGGKVAKAGRRKAAKTERHRSSPGASLGLAQLTRELKEAREHQTANAEVLRIIASSAADLQSALNTLLETATRLCQAERAAIFLPKGVDDYVLAASAGHTEESKKYLGNRPFKRERGSVVGRVLLQGETVHIPDVAADPEYTMGSSRRTLLGVPLLREGIVVGVLGLARPVVRPFNAKHIELVSTFANQAVIAIENARLLNELRQRTMDLSKSLDDLRTAQDRLVQTQKLASLGQLTAGIAHEIKNPLNFVNNFSSVSVELIDELQHALRDAPLTEKARAEINELSDTLRDNLDKIVQHGKRADSIVKNMLVHSREGSGERRSADINALVGESLNLAYHGARAEKPGFSITLKHDLDAEAGAVDLYPQEITRALLNVISNGFYAATRRRVEAGNETYEPVLIATTRNLGTTVEIRIRDNGTGISPEVREKMFNPFFTTKPTGEGTGLGLSMTHDIIVKQHGGRIDVETEPGVFTEFIITLPRGSIPSGDSEPE